MNTNQRLLFRFNSQAESCQARLDKFATKFAEDAAYALSWGTEAFQAAAMLRVLKQVIGALNEEGTLENIRSTLTDRVMHKAKYPPQSTSPTSNTWSDHDP
jgi:hypothetical protein